jgi:hypothetical protein
VARVAAQVVNLLAILGRYDETELVAIFPTARLEGCKVRLIRRRAIALARLTITADAFALDVAQMGRC